MEERHAPPERDRQIADVQAMLPYVGTEAPQGLPVPEVQKPLLESTQTTESSQQDQALKP